MNLRETVDWNGLLDQARQNQPDALNALLEKLRVRLWPILQYRLWGWRLEDQEDLLQEALMTFVQKTRQGEVNDNPQRYAAAILRNKILDAIKTRPTGREEAVTEKDWERLLDKALGLGENLEDELTRKLDRENQIKRLTLAISDLGDFCRDYFKESLRGLSPQEIFAAARRSQPNLDRSAFDVRTHRCRQTLKEKIQGMKWDGMEG